MKVLKAHEMSELDRKTIEEIGVPSPVLMENAGRGLLKAVQEKFPKAKRILVVSGKGNNGGDGIALARMLKLRGIDVDLFLPMGEPPGDGKLQLSIFRAIGMEPLKGEPEYSSYDLIVDALFGTGFKPPVRGSVAEVIEKINSSKVPVLAVDIPSGLSADSGEVFSPSISAVVTVTFQFPKLCHYLHPASALCGEVLIEDISIPPQLAQDIKRELITPENLQLPRRAPDTYKTREGHVLIIGGSAGKTGAVVLSAKSATRAGSGLVTVGVPKGLNHIFESLLIEEMSLPLEGKDKLSLFSLEEIEEELSKFSAIALGMGMGRYEEGQDIVLELLEKVDKPLLLDADGLNNLADSGELEVLKRRMAPTVLTPHVGEFSRLSGLKHEDIIYNLADVAESFAREFHCYVVLKSSRTVIATPEGWTFLSIRGTPAMAKGGMGDALAGILVSLLPRMETLSALKLGVYLHGLSGELAEKEKHRESLRTMDLIENIPNAYKSIENFLKESDTIYQDDRQS